MRMWCSFGLNSLCTQRSLPRIRLNSAPRERKAPCGHTRKQPILRCEGSLPSWTTETQRRVFLQSGSAPHISTILKGRSLHNAYDTHKGVVSMRRWTGGPPPCPCWCGSAWTRASHVLMQKCWRCLGTREGRKVWWGQGGKAARPLLSQQPGGGELFCSWKILPRRKEGSCSGTEAKRICSQSSWRVVCQTRQGLATWLLAFTQSSPLLPPWEQGLMSLHLRDLDNEGVPLLLDLIPVRPQRANSYISCLSFSLAPPTCQLCCTRPSPFTCN